MNAAHNIILWKSDEPRCNHDTSKKSNPPCLADCSVGEKNGCRQRPREIGVALSSTTFENAKSHGLDTVAAWANYFAQVSGQLADA
jgi:hypothetical protein